MALERVVLFHAGCTDGFAAAWAVHIALLAQADAGVIETKYIPVNYGKQPPNEIDGKHVVMVDFSYPRDTIIAMRKRVESMIILDHHDTAEKDLNSLLEDSLAKKSLPSATGWRSGVTPIAETCSAGLLIKFDMARSGAGLTWDFFLPDKNKNPRPWIIDYVEDRDLWRFKLPHSKEISAELRTWPHNFDFWDAKAFRSSTKEDAIRDGTAIVRYQDMQIADNIKHYRMVKLVGCPEAPIVNLTDYTISESLGELAKKHPFAVSWFQRADGMYVYSLRSRKENPAAVDVGNIAKSYGGGGHVNAAGFTHQALLG